MNSRIGFTVLVVEDNDDLRTLICDHIAGLGFQYESAGCGEEALKILKTTSVQVVVSDIQMPNGTGVWLLRKVRETGNQLPFFVFSGGSEFSKETILKMGASGYFEKPMEFGKLFRALEKLLPVPQAM